MLLSRTEVNGSTPFAPSMTVAPTGAVRRILSGTFKYEIDKFIADELFEGSGAVFTRCLSFSNDIFIAYGGPYIYMYNQGDVDQFDLLTDVDLPANQIKLLNKNDKTSSTLIGKFNKTDSKEYLSLGNWVVRSLELRREEEERVQYVEQLNALREKLNATITEKLRYGFFSMERFKLFLDQSAITRSIQELNKKNQISNKKQGRGTRI